MGTKFDPASIVTLRESLKLTQKLFADRLGVSLNTVSRWETREASPRAEQLAAMYDLAAESGLDFNPFARKSSAAVPRPFDVFISHSSEDKDAARRLVKDLRNTGLTVWFDEDEILVGHDIVVRVFDGISKSEFVVVLLSPKAVQSGWVQKELSAKQVRALAERRVGVLPAVVTPCEIPASLEALHHADLSTDWDAGVRKICAAIQGHRLAAATESEGRGAEQPAKGPVRFTVVAEVLNRIASVSTQEGCPSDMPVKDVALGPPDGMELQIHRQDLRPLVDACTVQMAGWGGEDFPYGFIFPKSVIKPIPDGVRVVDHTPWPYATRSFHMFEARFTGHLGHRKDVAEEHMLDMQQQLVAKGRLSVEWALLDIVRPMLFAQNLIRHLGLDYPIGVMQRWSGLRGRSLILLNRNYFRDGLSRYVIHEDVWSNTTVVRADTDLREPALQAATELFWLFGWDKAATSHVPEAIDSLVQGKLPS